MYFGLVLPLLHAEVLFAAILRHKQRTWHSRRQSHNKFKFDSGLGGWTSLYSTTISCTITTPQTFQSIWVNNNFPSGKNTEPELFFASTIYMIIYNLYIIRKTAKNQPIPMLFFFGVSLLAAGKSRPPMDWMAWLGFGDLDLIEWLKVGDETLYILTKCGIIDYCWNTYYLYNWLARTAFIFLWLKTRQVECNHLVFHDCSIAIIKGGCRGSYPIEGRYIDALDAQCFLRLIRCWGECIES